jgi:DNA phosphorothioation-associated DGQHR protein 1
VDLPKSLQAQIFAVINSTQKRVDRSLTYELFGYNLAEEDESYWTPDKLAVFLTRKLATDQESPLRGRILVAPKRDENLQNLKSEADWHVSTAVIADGVLRLFSSNPKRDSNHMLKGKANQRSSLHSGSRDRSPMRKVFIDGNDALLYKMVLNYAKACALVFWNDAPRDSFIRRTTGVQAVFDILRRLAAQSYEAKNISVKYFADRIGPAGDIDFAAEEFRKPSGSGRTLIRKTIEDRIRI